MTSRFAGRYRLLKTLGRGGMGEVFLALDLTSGAECALKRLAPRGSLDMPDLRREFDALTRVRHPAVVAALELGLDEGGVPFYTMEYVPGRTVDVALARGDWAALCFVAAEVAHGLEALHPAGVVHGDLKPSNLMVMPGSGPTGRPAGVRMLDFGLAALFGADNLGHHGTPGFAAPEVVRGEAASAASDLYGLGSTMFALAAGRPPFGEERPSSALRRQRAGPPPARPLEEAGAPAALVRLILRLLSPEIDERPRDAHEVRRELERIHPAAARPLSERMQAERVVGRERELARLATEAPAGAARTRVTVLCGEPGAGKSALLSTLAARAALAGRGVAMLSCSNPEASGISAFARRLAFEAGIEAGSDASAPPAVRALLSGETDEPEDADLGALADAAVRWCRAWADRAGAPLFLLDDFDRLEPRSRAFVRRLVLHPEAPPARWVWARRGSAASAPEDERLLLEAGVGEALELSPLGEPDLARLAAARLGRPAPVALVEFLWGGSHGHPGLGVELLRAAAAGGALREDDTGLIVAADELAAIRAPADFEESLIARLDALGGGAHAAALALAVCGRPERPDRLRAIAPAAEDATLARLVDSGLAVRDEAGRLRLAPTALARPLLERLDEPARRALHVAALAAGPLPAAERFAHLSAAGNVGEALEAASSAWAVREDERIAVEAAALAERECPVQAAAWHERAARALAARGRYDSAAPHAARALELDSSSAERPARWVLLSTATLRAGRPEDGAQVAARALAEPLPPAMRSRLLSNEAVRIYAAGDPERAEANAREAVALAEGDGDPEALGVGALTLASVLKKDAPPEEFDALTARALEAFIRAGNPVGQLRVSGSRGNAAHRRQRRDEARRIYDEAIASARAQGLRFPLEELLVNCAVTLLEDGRFAEAREALGEAARLALEDGRPRGAAIAIANLAQVEGLFGRRATALRHARHAIRLASAFLPEREAFAWRSLAQAERNAGRRGRALAAARRALTASARFPDPNERDWCRIELGRAAAAAGHWSEAGRVWDGALEEKRSAVSTGRLMLAALAGRAALRRGELEAAGARLAEAERGLTPHAAPYAAAMTDALRAELALARGRAAEGVEAAGSALERFRSISAFPERAHAALEFSRLVLAREGETRAPAGAWLELAAAAFERLGDHRGREQALALTVEWLRRAGPEERPDRARDLLRAVGRLLDSISDFRELTRRAMRLAVEQLDAERGVLLLADPETGRLEPVAEHGAVDAATRRDAVGYSRRVVERVAESGGSLLITDAPSDPDARSPSVLDLRLRSIVCVPMHLGGRVVGAVYLDDSRRPDLFGEEDRALLEGFAHLMAVAIEKSRGHEEMVRVNEQLVGENLSLRKEVGARFQPQSLIGTSLAMQRVLALVARAAQVSSTVLLTGENGTGKELIARILHHAGKRRLKPFVAVNCGAIPKTLLESELFGILPQVATGVRGRDGRFVQADGGTLFLDEIGEMPLEQQVALLSAISNREITPVGGGSPISVDVRIIAATNVDLRQMLEQGGFREDLYYRLNVIPIEIPPLRERKADIPALARHFVELYAHQQERKVPRLAREFMAALVQSDWPGNVRELQNYIERVLAMTPGDTLYPDPPPRHPGAEPAVPRRRRGASLAGLVEELERKAVAEALERSRGNQSLAARELGLTEQSLRYRLRKYGLLGHRQNRRTRRNS